MPELTDAEIDEAMEALIEQFKRSHPWIKAEFPKK